MKEKSKNPFTVTTPENLTAQEVKDLFVDVFNDFPKVPREGHVFIHGPRGSGKSMIFRYLQPDCQCLANQCSIRELPYYGIYVPLKNTDLKLTELRRLEDQYAEPVLNEHFMVVFIAQALFSVLGNGENNVSGEEYALEVKNLYQNSFLPLLKDCGLPSSFSFPSNEDDSVYGWFSALSSACEMLFKQVISYLKRQAFQKETSAFDGPLCGYLDFLYPLLCALKKMSFMSRGPIFLLIDDADNLNITQTKILNSWVSTRTSANVSLKISTQLRYKTYQTSTNTTIDSPHDFSEVNISTVYTSSNKDKYFDRVKRIVDLRLKYAKIDQDSENFFPSNEEQEREIRDIGALYKANFESSGKGFRSSDDVTRYSRPDYMKNLAGARKSSHSYSYSGFEQLVHISSGVIRYFLEAAANMYSSVEAASPGKAILSIPHTTQNQIVRLQADDFLFKEFERIQDDKGVDEQDKSILKGLFNLIKALGGTFRLILLSERSERRVFSIAFSDEPKYEVLRVLKLGERLGYFHVSAIGNKDGTGRTRLYVLSRRLAPHFNLDPTSFAGYLFVTNASVMAAIANPNLLLRRIETSGIEDVFEQKQLNLFD